jgi:hypothetical protein
LAGRKSRNKGLRVERLFAALHEEAGLRAERVPLSGSAGGSFTGDLIVEARYRAECKSRAKGSGFSTIADWLDGNDFLFLKADRQAPLVVMPWHRYLELMGGKPDVDG